ncbi:hypothetical protein ACFXDP_29695, partial [Streptomyces sp. NPDC059374]|uniref:hypothetical protein n=1 Tax=Streptomyces sp. NPDC059374 TaxID=3346814 RepID=UPI00369AF50D
AGDARAPPPWRRRARGPAPPPPPAPPVATVPAGRPPRHRLVFVPLVGATVGPGYLKVAYPKNLVRDAPSIDMDGVLPAEDEKAVFAHYELAYQPGAAGERRLARR